MSKPYLDGQELKRARMLVFEINDFMNAIETEVNLDRAYKSYLQEKINSLEIDVRCLKALIEE